nr:U11/U12 small nuclear ribonucleoprotein 25 kDa protein isoform X1 [Ipomoea trifida]
MKKARLHSTLGALLNDPILADVPKKPSLSDVDTLISLELGSAMRITILKLDNTSIDVAVLNSATVKDLKQAVRKKIEEMEDSKMGHRHISWKHVWENFCFSYHNEKLLDDGAKLQDYGVRNNCEVQFIPYIMSRASQRHSRGRKHRFFHGLNRVGRADNGITLATVYKEEDDEIGDEEIPIMDGGDGMEIGFPTDVKHVTHIGLDGAATSLLSPNWRQPTADVDLFSRQNLLITGNDSPHPPPAVTMVAAPGGTAS